MRWKGHVARTGKNGNAYRVVIMLPPRRRWESNIKIDLREIEWWCRDRISLPRDTDQWQAIVNTLMNLPVP
jgi:hypothetical protein